MKPPDVRSARDRPVLPEPPLLFRPMFVAGRKHREICDSPQVRTSAQSRAALESPRAREPYIARYEFSPAALLRAGTLTSKQTRSLDAYDPHLSRAKAPHRTSSTKSRASVTDRRHDAEVQVPVTSGPRRSRPAFVDLSHARYSAHRLLKHLIPSVLCFIARTRSLDNTAYNSDPPVLGTFPNCLVPLQATDLPSRQKHQPTP